MLKVRAVATLAPQLQSLLVDDRGVRQSIHGRVTVRQDSPCGHAIDALDFYSSVETQQNKLSMK